MDRRTWIRSASSVALGAWASGCAGAATEPGAGPTPDGASARGAGPAGPVPVRITGDNEIRTVVGLRPFRPSGFVVRAERLDDTLVVHDYGHGGGGITLSWGTAEMAVEAAVTEHRQAAVLGCGVVGLSTAHLLQRRGWDVTIYARDLPPDTTSNVAGGLWAPTSVSDGPPVGAFGARFREASERAYRAFQELDGRHYGIRWRTNYQFSDQPPTQPYWMSAVPHLFPEMETLAPGEHPFPAAYALVYKAMVIEPPIYLRALLEDVRRAGGRIVVREFSTRADVAALPEPVVFNCTGLGAGALFGDDELMPIKGQLHVLMPQPEVDYVTLSGGTYMIPRADGILLGGTFVRGDGTLEPDARARDRILAAHTTFFNDMRGPTE